MFWTDERIEELRTRWNGEGQSASEICAAMGVSRNAVIGKAHRLGLNVRATKHANNARRSNSTKSRKINHQINDLTGAIENTPPNLKPLLALRSYDCRWPAVGYGAATLYCGARAVDGHPYCSMHCRIAYIAPGSRPKAPRDFTVRRS
jgi:GcrA cell cycle regulator